MLNWLEMMQGGVLTFVEQEKEIELKLYDELRSIGKVKKSIRQTEHVYLNQKRKHRQEKNQGHPTLESMLDILHRCFENGEDIKSVSEETGYIQTGIYTWRCSRDYE